jgi:hypothetical protein
VSPSRFLAKSAESAENKRVEFLVSAKKCKIVQKSTQEFERKEDSSKVRGKVGTLNSEGVHPPAEVIEMQRVEMRPL